MAYSTAATIINRAAVQLGLASVADPYTSTDSNFVQLCEFLSTLGDDMLRDNDWTHLRKEYTFTTVLGQSIYALPSDFHDMLDQTGWNRSTFLPLGGPLSSQQWQFIKSRLVGVVFNVLFRMREGELELVTTTIPDGQTIAFEYVSTSWVRDAADATVDTVGQPVGGKSAPTQAGDLVLFDPLLMARGLKLLWSQAKGFDTTIAQQDFDRTLQHEIGKNEGAPILSLHRRARVGDRLLDGDSNTPITGYGN